MDLTSKVCIVHPKSIWEKSLEKYYTSKSKPIIPWTTGLGRDVVIEGYITKMEWSLFYWVFQDLLGIFPRQNPLYPTIATLVNFLYHSTENPTKLEDYWIAWYRSIGCSTTYAIDDKKWITTRLEAHQRWKVICEIAGWDE